MGLQWFSNGPLVPAAPEKAYIIFAGFPAVSFAFVLGQLSTDEYKYKTMQINQHQPSPNSESNGTAKQMFFVPNPPTPLLVHQATNDQQTVFSQNHNHHHPQYISCLCFAKLLFGLWKVKSAIKIYPSRHIFTMHCSIKQKNADKIKNIVSKENFYGTIKLETFYCNNQYLYIELVELKMWLKVNNLEPRFDAAAIHIYFEFWQLGEHLSSKIIVETKKEYLILWQPIDYAATVIQTQFQLLSLKYNLLSSPRNLSFIT